MIFVAYLIEAVPVSYSTMNVDFRLESPNRLDIEFSVRWCEQRMGKNRADNFLSIT